LTSPEVIGVDLGGTRLRTGVVDDKQRIRHESHERSAGRSEEEILDAIEAELREAREARPGVAAAGLGIPCTIDQERGVAVGAVNLPIANVPIRDEMRRRLEMPVYIDNDANCAALAEHRFGAARGTANAVMLTVGTGIGGGLILGGELYRGSVGAGAELGHLVTDYDGPRCQGTCPNYGCVEVLSSGTQIGLEGRDAAEKSPKSALGRAVEAGEYSGGETVTRVALEGDETARQVLTDVGRRLGAALSSLANIFNPDVIVIGGGASAAGDLLLDPARGELRARALPPMNETPVRRAELEDDAGVIGAATMAWIEREAGR
jgi:glucokinase